MLGLYKGIMEDEMETTKNTVVSAAFGFRIETVQNEGEVLGMEKVQERKLTPKSI